MRIYTDGLVAPTAYGIQNSVGSKPTWNASGHLHLHRHPTRADEDARPSGTEVFGKRCLYR
jgi:hypothetical protein